MFSQRWCIAVTMACTIFRISMLYVSNRPLKPQISKSKGSSEVSQIDDLLNLLCRLLIFYYVYSTLLLFFRIILLITLIILFLRLNIPLLENSELKKWLYFTNILDDIKSKIAQYMTASQLTQALNIEICFPSSFPQLKHFFSGGMLTPWSRSVIRRISCENRRRNSRKCPGCSISVGGLYAWYFIFRTSTWNVGQEEKQIW
jgi:hypothetical protein